jgi:DNA-binding MurR/RpiR family transcriptional regulator
MGKKSVGKDENLKKPSDIESRILTDYGTMSRSERLLADAILAEPVGISQYSASELAERAGVSKATAARFFRRLGYANYKAARVAARENRHWGSPLDALTQLTAPLEARGNLGVHLANDVTNLTRTGESIDPAQVNLAVRALAKAPRLFVMGFRNSYSLASYAFGVINTIRPNTLMLTPGNPDLVELLADLGPEDTLFAVGFRRRPLMLRHLMSIARERKATTILLSDTDKSKSAKLANVVLVCENRGAYLFDSYVAGTSMINFLCSALAMELGAAAWHRLEEIEKLHESMDDLATHPT